jgi:predicted component of type VI protein secretion system
MCRKRRGAENAQMGYLFWGLGNRRPPANRRTPKLEQADKAVVADFMILQSVWRRRRSLRGTSREERQGRVCPPPGPA